MSELIPHSRPWLTPEDADAVREVLASGMIAQGERTSAFEWEMASWVGAAGGVATSSGSAALQLALTALEVGAGHEVVLPSYVCPSVQEAVVAAGAQPVLCDVGRDWVMTPSDAAAVVGKRTRALVVPHLYGIFADLGAFRAFGLPIVEDCAQAVDARGRRRIEGDVAVFSFHPTKCLTTGEGGMAVSKDAALVAQLRRLRDGETDASRRRLFAPLSDIAAELGLCQLARYEQGLLRRRRIVERYRSALADVAQLGLPTLGHDRSMYFRFPLRAGGGAERYQARFAQRGVAVRRGVDKLLHRLRGLSDTRFPRSVEHFETTVSLPIYPSLDDEQLERCTRAAREVFLASPPLAGTALRDAIGCSQGQL